MRMAHCVCLTHCIVWSKSDAMQSQCATLTFEGRPAKNQGHQRLRDTLAYWPSNEDEEPIE